ncbi:branched-chain amino acid ABC transporter permease [Metallumcola ferriviriculae]|uniref:Branched-chain amino acid ABC transporter permease n=1 Tax=Metallumcola ferriviriculae TaxID=3039180 RepID=A0AAU0URR7_9FIRM|nr:branched-chain amino acid ABC transporter permease [Desulfitibacteraceae bacterium MK1]
MKKKWLLIICAILFFIFPFIIHNNYFVHIMIMAGINVILVLSLNLISGFVGQISLGHAAFFGIGAYASALLALRGVPVWLSMAASIPVAAVFGVLVGYPVLRLRGHFFAIATLGFGEIVHLVLNNWIDLTHGPMGLSGIPRPEKIFVLDFSSKIHYYIMILFFVIVTIYFSQRLINSKVGRALVAIRTDEVTATAMGVDVTYYKMLAFTWSAALAGFAGANYAHFVLFLSPETFKLAGSINILLMLLIGGIGSISGAVIGGLFITVLSEYLRAFAEYQMFIYGVLIVVVVVFAPKGLSGLIVDVARKVNLTGAKKDHKEGAKTHEPANTAD